MPIFNLIWMYIYDILAKNNNFLVDSLGGYWPITLEIASYSVNYY